MPAETRTTLGLGLVLVTAILLALLEPGISTAAPSLPAHRRSVTAGLDCSACHTTDGWKGVSVASGQTGFDHSRTGFPLTQRHASVPCAGCHNAGRQITRQCAGCHQDSHGGQLGAGCDGCHSAEGVRVHEHRLPAGGTVTLRAIPG
jgi:hypothetical protein